MMHWNGFMGWMWIFWLLVIVALFFVVLRAAAGGGKSSGTDTSRPSPEDVLKERYARGEIGKEEYDSKLQDLRR